MIRKAKLAVSMIRLTQTARNLDIQLPPPPQEPKKISNRTIYIHLTDHGGDKIIIPEHMDSITITTQMPPNMHHLVGKGLRYHPSHKPPKVVTLNNPIFHKWLIERYIDGGLTPIGYVKWLENFRDAALPGWLTIESDNPNYDTDMAVLIDFEERSVEHGQEDNIPFNLTLYEYIGDEEKYEEHDPTPVYNTITTVEGDSLWRLTWKIEGSNAGGLNWRDLYELNQGIIHHSGDDPLFMQDFNLIPPGTVLLIPEHWQGTTMFRRSW